MYLQASFDAARVGRDGLPVKRVNHSRRSPVVADSEELDAWILHRIQLPPGASRERTDNLQRDGNCGANRKKSEKNFGLEWTFS